MATFKIPSIDLLWEESKRVVLRFPATIASSFGLFMLAIMSFNLELPDQQDFWIIRAVLIMSLGLALFTALHCWLERQSLPEGQKAGIIGGFVALLLLYFWLLPDANNFSLRDGSRHVVFVIVAHLLVAFLPFLARRQDKSFWYFNLMLFGRVLMTIIYCQVLSYGILGAVGAVHFLFTLNIHWKVYMYIGLFINILLNTFIFLSGVPENYEELEEIEEFPIALKLFAQYIFMPLITLYGVILYAYGLMILFSWSLPKGIVIPLMIGFCLASMFGLVLVYPVRERAGNQWIKIFSQVFYIAILPLMLLYFVAIGYRVSQYGITADRYFVIIAGLWLVGIALYFIISKQKRIIFIPLTLSVVGLFSVVGPWSAYSVGAYSQSKRFAEIVTRTGILTDGKFDLAKKRAKKISKKDDKELLEIGEYLLMQGQITALQPYFKEDLSRSAMKSDKKSDKKNEKKRFSYQDYMVLIGEQEPNSEKEKYGETQHLYAQKEDWQKVEGYQYLLSFSFANYADKKVQSEIKQFTVGKLKLALSIDYKTNKFIVESAGKEIATLNMQPTFNNITKTTKKSQISQGEMTIQHEGSKHKISLQIESVSIRKSLITNTFDLISSINGVVLIKITE